MNVDLDKNRHKIRAMFDGVAPRYDLLNHLLSGYLDIWWRQRAARAIAAGPGEEILDLCCGTGDQAVALRKGGARVVAADFCVPMLLQARPKLDRLGAAERPDPGSNGHAPSATRQQKSSPGAPPLAAADALALPFPDRRFDAATVSFGLRNVADLDRALGELHRVLKPGGRLVVLEFTTPQEKIVQVPFQFYFRHILPRIGALLSAPGGAYEYLPASVVEFPQRDSFTDRMAAAGFSHARWRELTFGVVCIYEGRRP
jgi:demethylmenaquinone methyltransferase/2-methoxy-6-polyprenyl-1,4-benzoquinol methylase